MNISWKNFAQRRKLDIQMFMKMSYIDYCRWCEVRSVTPIEESLFVKNTSNSRDKIEPTVESVDSSQPVFDIKKLKKLRKSALSKLCTDKGIEHDSGYTKNQLVHLLLCLNNT